MAESRRQRPDGISQKTELKHKTDVRIKKAVVKTENAEAKQQKSESRMRDT